MRNQPRPETPSNPASARPSGLNRRQFCALSLGSAAAGLAGSALASLAAEPTPVEARPERRWELFIIQHSHIDIGYTDRQEVIAEYHRDFVRQAIEMALSPKQSSRHRDCRFKYTIEGFWSLEQFLQTATQTQRRNLGRALKSGLVELTAGYFHMTELLDEELLRSTLAPAQRFARREGLKLEALMGCDINGFSWGYCELLAEMGVKYLSMNINTHHGGVPLGKPLTPFYWESPSGKRLLVWNGLPYHRGNVMGLMGYLAPDTDLGIPGLDLPPRHRYEEIHDISMAERKLLPTLAHLEQNGYPFAFLPLMGNAVYTDNGPAGDQYCDLIAQWNAKHGQRIHIRTATLIEFFRHLENTVKEIPVCRGDWTDWWSDGVAATPLDTLIFRNAQRTRHLVRALDPQAQVISPERLEHLDRKLALYAEHTFGYSDTTSASLLTHQVFLRKTMHAVEADTLAGQALVEVTRRRGEGEFTARRPFTYRVINPLNQPIRAVVALPTDYWEYNLLEQGVRVLSGLNQPLPCQLEPAPRGRVILTLVELRPNEEIALRAEPARMNPPRTGRDDGFHNAFYRAAWDSPRGWYRLIEAASDQDLITPGSTGLGCPIYQLFPSGNRGAAAGFGYSKRNVPDNVVSTGRCVSVRRLSTGDVLERWELSYEVPGTTRYALQLTCYRDLPQIDLTALVLKTEVTDPEGLYVAFPVAIDQGVWHLDKPGGPIRPGIDQLPGSCCDYYCVQAGAALVGRGLGLAWATLDAPLVQLGKLRLWNYSTRIEPTGPIYSWLTNNKWETNFRLTCGGRYEFRYRVQAAPAFENAAIALDAGRALSMPPVVLRG
ncbi:MAG: hypothetical protein KJ072_07830 [Verrucomicrobia bacterium]|nr:hypothetical protein [Verrucomicrobiota bacterium]